MTTKQAQRRIAQLTAKLAKVRRLETLIAVREASAAGNTDEARRLCESLGISYSTPIGN